MKPVDYRCVNLACEEVREIYVPDDKPIPKYITCYKCGNNAKRLFSAPGTIIHQGRCGNANNSYTSSPVSIKKT